MHIHNIYIYIYIHIHTYHIYIYIYIYIYGIIHHAVEGVSPDRRHDGVGDLDSYYSYYHINFR